MSTYVTRLSFGPSGSASTGSFREFVGFIQTAFNGSGFINQAASGAINTSSVNPPSAVNQVRGYDVYAFGDSLQATQPLFVRLEYRSLQMAAFNAFGLNVYIGERHDGNGNLDSLYATTSFTVGNANNGTSFTAQQSASALYTGASGSRVAVVMAGYASGTGADSPQFWFNLTRTNDWTGQLTTSGAVVHFGCATGTIARAGHDYHSMELGKRYLQLNGHVPMLSLTTGSTPVLSPLFVGKGNIEPNGYDVYATINTEPTYVATNSNITGSNYTLNAYGVNHNYIRMPIAMGGGSNNTLYTNALMTLLLRYE